MPRHFSRREINVACGTLNASLAAVGNNCDGRAKVGGGASRTGNQARVNRVTLGVSNNKNGVVVERVLAVGTNDGVHGGRFIFEVVIACGAVARVELLDDDVILRSSVVVGAEHANPVVGRA
ncbi:hypothetical protein EJ997_05890 [Flaviflexus ciconiae]|uniref:Uncharacterized protein n=1 Tax=Flaviflexus ciconiae TaxID=2496867 RepID=A0A3Q9G7C2_9ACTO|nr:hypothetical protein [Flaviflexus ciconiae]AZQ76935.1 hypothetical protein EJ997_05890 [Flaviflexus ciconiae]